ncbi:MAG: hypothetical protein ACOZAJ_01540 [Patescibacteria group bacterium]
MSKTKIIIKILAGLLMVTVLAVLFLIFGFYSLMIYGLKFVIPSLKRKLEQAELAYAPKW